MYLRWKAGDFEVSNTTHTCRNKLLHGVLRRILPVANTINTTELYLISYQAEQNDGASVERRVPTIICHVYCHNGSPRSARF